MDQEPDDAIETTPDSPPKPVIPPPDLSRPAPPPPSPLENLPKSSPPPLADAGNAAARVNLRDPLEEGDESPAKGLAPFNTRITAAVIDILVAMGITISLTFLLPGFATKLAWLTGFAYMVVRDSLPFLGGQSVGKKAMKLKAVTLDGKSLVNNWEAALIRNGLLIIVFFGLIELFILLTREDKPERGRRLGDEWAKTRVIVEPKLPAQEEAG
jgi:uncharacterized RDD family membrane protein YckC